MKAVILAGGMSTRLKPITSELPKPLVRISGEPVLEHIITLLRQNDITDITVAVMFKGEQIAEYLSEKHTNIDVVFEGTPLGTAGAVKACIGDITEDILVISGDCICDFDLKNAIAYHKSQHSYVTIITKNVENPCDYGLVIRDENGYVTSFIEKPSSDKCVSNTCNCGVYLLNPKIFSLFNTIPLDFANDVFKSLLQKGYPINTILEAGYWCDIGEIRSLLQCQTDVLYGAIPYIKAKESYIHKGANIDSLAVISHSSIDEGSTVSNGAKISGSIIGKQVYIGENVTINCAIICDNARIEANSSIFEGSVVGDFAVIMAGATICPNVRVWGNKVVMPNVTVKTDLKYGYARNVSFTDNGIEGETNTTITSALAVKIGSAIGSLSPNQNISIGVSQKNCSKALGYSIASGIMMSGSNVYWYSSCFESQFAFCASKNLSDYSVFVTGTLISQIKIRGNGGIALSRYDERRLEAYINNGNTHIVGHKDVGTLLSMRSLKGIYAGELINSCPYIVDFNITVKSQNLEIKQLFTNILLKLGAKLGNDIIINISMNGEKATFYSDETGIISNERLKLLGIITDFKRGRDVTIERYFSHIVERLAVQYGCNVVRLDTLSDGLFLTLKLFRFMTENKLNLKELNALAPEFNTKTSIVEVSVSPFKILEKFRKEKAEIADEVICEIEGKERYLSPVKGRNAIRIVTDTYE